jgi:alcohol dehydrogenase
MLKIKHFFYRLYQKMMVLVVKIVPNKKQKLINGDLEQITPELTKLDLKKYLVVTDNGIVKAGLLAKLTMILDNLKLDYKIYDKTLPNPDIKAIDEAVDAYHQASAQAIIAIGGGSPIDLAKVVAAKVARPDIPIIKMKGILKVLKKIPPLIVIPTTSGTGSEVTIAAVVSNHETKSKFAIIDPNLLPDIVVLDPKLTLGMPPFITATTGLDALTHGIESYLGNSNTSETKSYALDAIKLVFDNILTAYQQPSNLEARRNMQIAAYKAGYAFTRAYVGNVHAMAHALGGHYDVVHGLVNAMLMPHVFRSYGLEAQIKLASIARHLNLTNNPDNAVASKVMIEALESLNDKLGIPKNIKGIVKEKDLPHLIDHAYKEANPFYPVPRIFTRLDFEKLFREIGI